MQDCDIVSIASSLSIVHTKDMNNTTSTLTGRHATKNSQFRTSTATWCRAGHHIPACSVVVAVSIKGSYTEQHWCEAHYAATKME